MTDPQAEVTREDWRGALGQLLETSMAAANKSPFWTPEKREGAQAMADQIRQFMLDEPPPSLCHQSQARLQEEIERLRAGLQIISGSWREDFDDMNAPLGLARRMATAARATLNPLPNERAASQKSQASRNNEGRKDGSR